MFFEKSILKTARRYLFIAICLGALFLVSYNRLLPTVFYLGFTVCFVSGSVSLALFFGSLNSLWELNGTVKKQIRENVVYGHAWNRIVAATTRLLDRLERGNPGKDQAFILLHEVTDALFIGLDFNEIQGYLAKYFKIEYKEKNLEQLGTRTDWDNKPSGTISLIYLPQGDDKPLVSERIWEWDFTWSGLEEFKYL